MASRGEGTPVVQTGASILRFPQKLSLPQGCNSDSKLPSKGTRFFEKPSAAKLPKVTQIHNSPESPLNRWLGALGFSPSQVAAVDARVGMVLSATAHGTTREKALSALAQDLFSGAKAPAY